MLSTLQRSVLRLVPLDAFSRILARLWLRLRPALCVANRRRLRVAFSSNRARLKLAGSLGRERC